MNFGVCSATRVGPTSRVERRLVAQRAVVDRPQLAAGPQHPGGRGEQPVGGRGHDGGARRGTAGCRRRGRRCPSGTDVGGVVPDHLDPVARGRSPPPSRRPTRPRPPTGRRRAPRSAGRARASGGGQDAGAAAEVERRRRAGRHPRPSAAEQRAGADVDLRAGERGPVGADGEPEVGVLLAAGEGRRARAAARGRPAPATSAGPAWPRRR